MCVEVDADGTLMYAVGSKSHVIFMDTREATSIWSMKSLDPNCGVRSLAFNQQLLSVGTGAGHIYFYDLRTRNWLLDKSGSQPCTLKPSDRWLVSYFHCSPQGCNNLFPCSAIMKTFQNHIHFRMQFSLIATVLSKLNSSVAVDHSYLTCMGTIPQYGYSIMLYIFPCEKYLNDNLNHTFNEAPVVPTLNWCLTRLQVYTLHA